MGTTKEINIKNLTYYFYNDIVDVDEFDESKIKVDKKDFNVWYLVISDKDDVSKKLVDIFKSIKSKITEKKLDALEYDKGYIR